MSDLLPCPFCGGKAETLFLGKSKVIIRCVYCYVQRTSAVKRFSVEWLEQKMCEWWNTRAAPSVDIDALADETAEKIRKNRELLEGGYSDGVHPFDIIKSALIKAQGSGKTVTDNNATLVNALAKLARYEKALQTIVNTKDGVTRSAIREFAQGALEGM